MNQEHGFDLLQGHSPESVTHHPRLSVTYQPGSYPHCDNAPSEETHHAQPSFTEITRRVFSAVSEIDIDTALAAWNWFEKQEFTVPQGHVIERLFDESHAAAQPCRRQPREPLPQNGPQAGAPNVFSSPSSIGVPCGAWRPSRVVCGGRSHLPKNIWISRMTSTKRSISAVVL